MRFFPPLFFFFKKSPAQNRFRLTNPPIKEIRKFPSIRSFSSLTWIIEPAPNKSQEEGKLQEKKTALTEQCISLFIIMLDICKRSVLLS